VSGLDLLRESAGAGVRLHSSAWWGPSKIKLGFQGAKDVSIDRGGELILRTGGGEIRQRKPFIYQELAASGERSRDNM
jgi:hypothetical protein